MNEPRRCVCPGSYDPVTLGHLDVIERAAKLYDEVYVIILHNPNKQGLFTPEERIGFLEAEIAENPGLANVKVLAFANRLLVDVCVELGIQAIVKGLRGETDYAYELPMAVMNRRLTGVETLFIPGAPEYVQVSSSLMKEVVRFGGDITGLVPPRVEEALKTRIG
ncbi:MAG: pantetheine-phosphate adenylyltransferase [Dermatophilus congolensis]|nr:pantetheine-phosphate adenylyltransferase [Dermatophilus congolensis]